MSEFNYVEQPIIPDMPKTVPNEVLHVYVPRATYKIPGIASFSDKYFVLDSEGNVKLTDYVIDATKEYVRSYLPLMRGTSENTIQQEGNTSGGKAFKFSKIDAGSKKFTLVRADGSNVSIDKVGYDVGDEYSFIFVHKYNTANGDSITYSANCKADFIGKIRSIQTETDGSVTVTVDTLHYTVKDDAVIADEYADYCLFFVPTKPTVGDISIGANTVTLGIDNINVGESSLVSGEGNINSGMYALMGGKYNKGSYGGLIGGRDNDGSANYVTVGGTNHKVKANRGAAFNLANEVLHENGTCVGEHNKTSAPDQFVGGKYANPSPEAILSMGNGTSEEQRANAFEVVVIDGVAYLRLNKTDLTINNNCLYFRGNKVTATHATALGLNTEAGSGSLANGRNSKAQGFCTTGAGDGIVITPNHAKGTAGFGKFNDYSNTNVAFMIGDGESDAARSNVFEVLKDGTANLGDKSVATVDLTKASTLIGVDNAHVGGGKYSLKQYRVQSSPFPGSVVRYDTVDKRFTIEEPKYNSNPATKNYVDTQIATFDFIKVVDALPAREDALPNKIYLVPKSDTQNQDLFDEWVWINKGTEEEPNFDWEWVTTKQLEVDLTPYATTEYVDEKLGEVETALDRIIAEQESIIAEQESILAIQNALIGGKIV